MNNICGSIYILTNPSFPDYVKIGYSKNVEELENRINEYRDQLRTEHTEAVKQNQYPYQTGISYSTLYAQCEKLADFAINVTEAIDKIKK